jgi:branched-chain amino acid transport system substrate-binding protein
MVGGVILVEALKRSGADPTRARLISSLEGLGHFETGLAPPLDWSASYHGGPKSFGYAQWTDGKLMVIQGW